MRQLNTIRRIALYVLAIIFVACVVWTIKGGIISVLIGTITAGMFCSIADDIAIEARKEASDER